MRIGVIAMMAFAAISAAYAMAAPPRVVAHRGYWTVPGSAENSIRSLVKADSVGCFGSELDVWATADDVLVVNHDPQINGVQIQTSSAKKVLAEKLKNGENVPSLESYLAHAARLKTKVVLELKTHDSRKHERKAIKNIIAMVKKYGLENNIDYITFSKYGFLDLIKFAPAGTKVFYLGGDYIPWQVKESGGAGIDYRMDILKNRPEWIKQSHDLGLEVNVWTVNDPDDIRWCIEHGIDYITTNEPEVVQREIEKYK